MEGGAAAPPAVRRAAGAAAAAGGGAAAGAAGAAAAAAGNAVLVSERQAGNPVLRHIRNVRWQHADIVPDYVLGEHTCALFLSLRYHLLHPEYLKHRALQLQGAFRLRVLLVLVDLEDATRALLGVTRAAVAHNLTLVCAWSPEECARYLETYKSYESKPADAIRERVERDPLSRLHAALTQVKGVNKTDVATLAQSFGTVGDLLRASADDLAACPGLGPTKVQRLQRAFAAPFRAPAAVTAAAAAAGGSGRGPARPDGRAAAGPADEPPGARPFID